MNTSMNMRKELSTNHSGMFTHMRPGYFILMIGITQSGTRMLKNRKDIILYASIAAEAASGHLKGLDRLRLSGTDRNGQAQESGLTVTTPHRCPTLWPPF
jgi:hypothetical protein